VAVAPGDRGVAVTGDVRNSVIVTGDNVTLNVRLDAAEGALLDRLAAAPQLIPWPTPLESRPRRFADHVDRDSEAAEALAGATQHGAANVYGEPGIGKSRLLSHAANTPEAASLPDGIAYVQAQEAPLDDVLQRLFEEFYDCGSPPVRPSRSRLRRELSGRQALVVVDGLELGQEDARAVLEAAPSCSFLVASTERRLWDAAPVLLAGFELPYALDLIEQELGRALTAEERPNAERLCEALAGHPWRIREAVARARDEGRSLADAARALGPADLLEALTVEERGVLAGLAGAGGGPVGLAHVRELSAAEDVEAVLEDLERRHLVESHSARFSLAGALRPEIEARWDLEARREHAIEHYADWSERHRGEPEVAEERPAVLDLLRWARRTGRDAAAIRLGRAVDPALAASGQFGSWGEAVDVVLGAARRRGASLDEAWALHQRGTLTACVTGPELGVPDLEAARDLRERIGDHQGEAATRHNLDVVRSIVGGGGGGGGGHGPAFYVTLAFLGALAVALGVVGGLLAYDRLSGDNGSATTTTTPGGTVLIGVPDVVGHDIEDARFELADAGLAVGEERRFSADAPEGVVVAQDPVEGTQVEEGTLVALTVSAGPRPVAVPDVVGLAEEEALRRLEDEGLKGTVTERVASNEFAAGLVFVQDPAAGTEVPADSTIALTVSNGPPPDLTARLDDVTDDCSEGPCFTIVSFTLANLSRGTVPQTFEVTITAEGGDPLTIEVEGFGAGESRKFTERLGPKDTCFDPDCFATVDVDSGDVVEETNEENNIAESSVIG
jgi:PASTA domain